MGSSYLGEDERGEYCETCYGRPGDVSKEEHERVLAELSALRRGVSVEEAYTVFKEATRAAMLRLDPLTQGDIATLNSCQVDGIKAVLALVETGKGVKRDG